MTGKFKFSLVSDLHIDVSPAPSEILWDLEGDVVIAGDTSNSVSYSLTYFAELECQGYRVHAVDGNHEHYWNTRLGMSVEQSQHAFYHGLRSHTCYVGHGLTVIGVNGWYPVHDENLWQVSMRDASLIGDSAKDVTYRALLDSITLAGHLRGIPAGDRAIVVTHTAPSPHTLNPAYAGHYSNEWFWNPHMSEILRQFSDRIAVWCHGHTHAAADKIVDGVRVVCNPQGYPGENPGWAPITIEVED